MRKRHHASDVRSRIPPFYGVQIALNVIVNTAMVLRNGG